MKIGIVGSRECGDRTTRKHEMIDMFGLVQPDTIISGGAIGIDQLAEECAARLGISIVILRPNWQKYGKRAGFLRNQLIVDACDELHAWWDGKSKGTKHSIDLANKQSKPVTVYRFNNG